MSIAVCPGSFDPVTHGHLDVIGRAAVLFDEVVVGVGVNPSKSRLFSDDERIAFLTEAVAGLSNVRVASFTGLVTAFCLEQGAASVVKGLRAGSDFDYELAMAQMNAATSPPDAHVDTVLLPTSPQWSFVSSSLVKEVARFGGDVAALVPQHVLAPLTQRLRGVQG